MIQIDEIDSNHHHRRLEEWISDDLLMKQTERSGRRLRKRRYADVVPTETRVLRPRIDSAQLQLTEAAAAAALDDCPASRTRPIRSNRPGVRRQRRQPVSAVLEAGSGQSGSSLVSAELPPTAASIAEPVQSSTTAQVPQSSMAPSLMPQPPAYPLSLSSWLSSLHGQPPDDHFQAQMQQPPAHLSTNFALAYASLFSLNPGGPSSSPAGPPAEMDPVVLYNYLMSASPHYYGASHDHSNSHATSAYLLLQAQERSDLRNLYWNHSYHINRSLTATYHHHQQQQQQQAQSDYNQRFYQRPGSEPQRAGTDPLLMPPRLLNPFNSSFAAPPQCPYHHHPHHLHHHQQQQQQSQAQPSSRQSASFFYPATDFYYPFWHIAPPMQPMYSPPVPPAPTTSATVSSSSGSSNPAAAAAAAAAANIDTLFHLAAHFEQRKRGISRDELDKLSTYRYKVLKQQPASTEEPPRCMVCLDDFETKQSIRVLCCRHEFHTRCIDKWLKINRTCPSCRADAFDGTAQKEGL